MILPALWISAAPATINIPLAMLAVFGTAKLLAELFEYFGQPGLVGEILAGVILGPSVLNWIQPNQVLTAFAELGVMFLLFRVGLEVKSQELLRVGRTALLVAVLGVIVPFVLGWAILKLWGAPQVECFFVGAAMVATSVGITAQVLASKGVIDHIASRIILAAAVIDDVLGLIVLALVGSMAEGRINWLELGLTAVAASAFTVIIARWGARAMESVMPRVERRLRAREAQFAVAMVVLFGLALLAEDAGVAAIIGAFLAGMALSETLDRRVHDLAHGVSELLVPFFLAGIGLHLDLTALAEKATVILAVVIFLAAVVSKLVGCGLGAVSLGWGNALRVGCGMAPRGEVGMVVAQIGLGIGVIAPRIYGVVVFMAVATTLIAPPLLNLTYRNVQTGPPVEEFKLG
jgi:Kef-type K+ transport system membrane component KefB